MKIKDDLIKWREQINALSSKISDFETKNQSVYEEIKDIKAQVLAMAKLTENMAETMLALLRQQIGD